MKLSRQQALIADLLQHADVTINGTRPWDIQIHNNEFYSRVLHSPSLGLGESYMDKWWDCDRLDIFFEKVHNARLETKVKAGFSTFINLLIAKYLNFQTRQRSLVVGRQHYDLGNDLFKLMLDKYMVYSCGYWKHANNLDQAQFNKLDISCKKLLLQSGMRLLDIGCGFGSLAKHAAQHYNVEVVGITISQQQYEYAKTNCAGLPVQIRFQDYRDLHEKFDRVISIGMFEHVGQKNYAEYFRVVKRCLANDGLFLLHSIGNNISTVSGDEWITKYIFPNGMLPSIAQIAQVTESQLQMEDLHNFSTDYDKTLMAWHRNFNKHWQTLKIKYDERFYRMWNYYLLSCAGTFRSRRIQLWQMVFSAEGRKERYERSTLAPVRTTSSEEVIRVDHDA